MRVLRGNCNDKQTVLCEHEERGRERGRKLGREGERERGREGEREGGREGGRERGRESVFHTQTVKQLGSF